MRTSTKRLTQLMIAFGALTVMTEAALPTFASENPALQIRAVTVHGKRVAITVSNVSRSIQRDKIGSRVVLADLTSTTVAAEVNAKPGETVTIEVPLNGPVSSDTNRAGVVVDDGVPF